jgi:hypothetical protein
MFGGDVKMTLKHRSKFITPMLDQIEDSPTKLVLQDLMHQLSDLWPNVYDDLANDGLIQKDYDNGTLRLLEGIRTNRTAVSTTPYAVLAADFILGVDTTAAITINLMSAATVGAGKILIVKDETGNATAENITIAAAGAETIDGAGSITIAADRGYRALYSDGTNWQIWGGV